MTEEDAWKWFVRVRWADTQGKPCCPACGSVTPAAIRRRRWRCRSRKCGTEFSVTRGTILANRKLSLRRLVMAIALSVQSVKGKSACQLKRELGIDYKSAFCLLQKLREAWREDRRRTDFRTQARLVLAAALAHPVSRNLARYWQTTCKAARALVGWSPLSGLQPRPDG